MGRVINCTKIKSTKNFENNVLKHFPKDEVNDIFITSVGMKRNYGIGGRYVNYLDIHIGNNLLSFSHPHNDSVGWDDYSDWEVHNKKYQDWAKSTVLALLSDNKETIVEYYSDCFES